MLEQEFAVRVEDLNVQFHDFYAVKEVSFSVKKGEIFGFLGANGAGKTTTIRVLCGLLLPTSGSVEVANVKLSDDPSILKAKVGYMSQKFTLYDDLTVRENLNLAGNLHFMKAAAIRERQEELLQFIGWSRSIKTMVKDLPGGQKQQMSLVAAIMHNPEILFLDEPTAGVSPAARAKFWELIKNLSQQGKTVFVTTHYMDEAEQCGRIALMRSGELVALDASRSLKAQQFPNGLLDLDPLPGIVMEEINEWKKKKELSLFQPHGMHFHAELKNPKDQDTFNQLSKAFKVQKIVPSLEDVFIRIVEGIDR